MAMPLTPALSCSQRGEESHRMMSPHPAAEKGAAVRSMPRATARWGGSLAFVLAAHAVIALLLVAHQRPPELDTTPPPAVLLDLAPSAAPDTPTPLQSGEPAVPPDTPAPDAKRPEPPPPPKAIALPKPAPHATSPRPKHIVERSAPRPAPPPLPQAPTTAAHPSLPSSPTAAAPGAPAPPASPASANARAGWNARLAAWLARNKRYPRPAQEAGQQGTVTLRFVLDRAGHVSSYRIERSSGVPLLDQEVLALIQRAQPLPAPPPEIVGERFEFVLPVAFTLSR